MLERIYKGAGIHAEENVRQLSVELYLLSRFPFRDVVDFEIRGCRKLKEGETTGSVGWNRPSLCSGWHAQTHTQKHRSWLSQE